MCSIDGCGKKAICKTWCSKHYTRWKRNGDPLYVTRSAPLDPGATEKYCPRCKQTLPVDKFKQRKSGAYVGLCIPCKAEYDQEYSATESGRENRRKARSGWNERSHEYFLQYRYGIGLEDYTSMALVQENRCAICRADSPGANYTKWAVDHCHETGVVRGLLCSACNMAIGQMKDDPERLRAAADYIERSRLQDKTSA